VTRRWPDSLPVPVGRGYRIDLADMARRTEFEVAVRARRITTTRRDRPTLAARLTDAEFAALRAWWGDEAWSLAGASDSLAGWTFSAASRTAGGAMGPDGVPCDILREDGSTGEHHAQVALAAPGWTAGDRATAVLSLLPVGRSQARVGLVGRDGVQRRVDVNVALRTVLALDADVEAAVSPVGAWTRVRITAPIGTGAAPVRLRVTAMEAGLASFPGGDGPALGVGQINARRGQREQGVFVPTGADGTALGAAGGSAWFFCPIAVGGGYVRRAVLPLGPLSAEPLPSLAWEFTLPVEARDA
jgi:hypothetical protein